MDWQQVQREWDAQQQTYMPDREERFAAMLDTVGAVAGTSPRILDLAAGTGSITLRALKRFPGATSVILDVDAALLTIATGTFAGDERVRVVSADLATPDWLAVLAEDAASFDAVLTATALHWLTAQRLAVLYAEIAGLLRPGAIFVNADHMPDGDLPGLTEALTTYEVARHERAKTVAGATDWNGWWDRLRAEPEMADPVALRDAHFADRGGSAHTESKMEAAWHVAALRDAGFAEAGLVWRGLTDAAVVGVVPNAS